MRRVKVTREQLHKFLKDLFRPEELTDEFLEGAKKRLDQRLLNHPDPETRKIWTAIIKDKDSAL